VKLEIIAEGPEWVVVNKPSGLMVHRSELSPNERFYAVQVLHKQLGQRVWPAHRLDRATSGCLLFSLSAERVLSLQQALAHEGAVKRYLALCRGHVKDVGSTITIDKPIQVEKGVMKEAKTTVTCVATQADPRCSLMLATPHTGRTHQVRRHLRDLDHPVLRDAEHGDSKMNAWWRDHQGLSRLALHCWSLDLPLADGQFVRATAPIPEDLGGLLRGLELWPRVQEALPDLVVAEAVP
jgi:tRNA pseudouridine65 synthase